MAEYKEVGTIKYPQNLDAEKQALIDMLAKNYANELRGIDDEKKRNLNKLRTGAALEIASAAIPGTAGAKLAGGTIKALVPKIGEKIAKEVGTGLVGGGLSGAVFGSGRGLMEDKNPLETAAYDALIGAALGGAGGAVIGKAGDVINRKIIIPTQRKMRAGINPLTKGDAEVLADMPNTETEAFKIWSGNNPLVSSDEALNYPFKTGKGVTLEGYHGTQRGDRVGSEFKKERATSGPMAYFSSDRGIAENYAKGKIDTSLSDEMSDYQQWFKYRNANGKVKPLGDSFYDMPYEERKLIRENAPHITTNDEGEIIFDANTNRGIGNYDYAIKQYRDNPLKALIDGWLEGGTLYGSENDFLKVLEKAGVNMKNIDYIDPYTDYSKVYDVFLSMKKPLVTNDIPTEVIEQLAKEAPNNPAKYTAYGDIWDKNTRDGVDWVNQLKDDIKAGENSHVWTSIPDWVTTELKKQGYDGIIDMGGKGGGQVHKVYIPFEPTQIKSQMNEGTFDLNNPNIYKAILGGLGSYGVYKNKNNINTDAYTDSAIN